MTNTVEERILKQLAKRKKGYTSKELASILGNHPNYIQRTLKQLVDEFKVQSMGSGSRYTKPVYTLVVRPQPVVCE